MTKFLPSCSKWMAVFFICNLVTLHVTGQPTCISVAGSSTPVSCFGSATGSIAIEPAGGSGNYSYTWSSTNGSWNVQNPSGLAAGIYTVLVRDLNNPGCTGTAQFEIVQPTVLNIEGIDKDWYNGFDLRCSYSADGQLTMRASGGTAPYSYSLNNGAYQSSNLFSNLPAGTYYATIKDANGCLVTSDPSSSLPHSPDFIVPPVVITPPPAIVASPISVLPTPSSAGVDSFSIFQSQSVTLMPGTITGGTENYTYSWSPAAGIANPLSASITVTPTTTTTYTLNIKDGNECLVIKKVTIVVASITGGGSDAGPTTGELVLCHNGKPLKVAPSAIPAHLRHGDYIGNCVPWATGRTADGQNLTVLQHDNTIAVFPNPSSGKLSVTLGDPGTAVELQLINSNGLIIEKRTVHPAGYGIENFDLTGKASGVYFIRVINEKASRLLRVVLK